MELNGRVIEVLAEQSGESARGPWRKQQYVLETDGQYPKKVCFLAWGDKIDEFRIKEGESLNVSIDLESREYNGRWYTDVKAWKVSRAADQGDVPFDMPGDMGSRELKDSPLDDDIPF